MYQKALTARVIGFAASLILTLATFLIVARPAFFHVGNQIAVLAIFILAVLQSVVQLVCFINLWQEKGSLWNLGVFVSTVSILFIIIAFSIWIMHHLDYNMMP